MVYKSRQIDRQTDGRTEFSSLDRVCIPCSAVKMHLINMQYVGTRYYIKASGGY